MKLTLLMTDENIVGREILDVFQHHGIPIDCVITEASPRAEKEKEYLKNSFHDPAPFPELRIQSPDMKVVCVNSLNGPECQRALEAEKPDLILLDGSTIIKNRIFRLARYGALNSHPGLLPEFRGVDSVRWALFQGKTVGATCHFIDDGIDTGPILRREPVSWCKGESLLEVRVRTMRVGAQIMAQAVRGLMDGSCVPVPQNPDEGAYFSWASAEVQIAVDKILASQALV